MYTDPNQKVVIILCGPPASGKSTWVKKYGNFEILSRDNVRDNLFGKKYSPNKSRENSVTYVYNILRDAKVFKDKDLIVDKTQCNEAHFKDEIKYFEEKGYFIWVKFFDVSYPMLIFRELKRRLTDRSKPSVPFKVIKDMKKRYDKLDRKFFAKYEL